MSDAREMFENWASAPPREFDIERLDEEDYSWPGSYRVYKVQCMWEAWCEQEENIKRRTAELERQLAEANEAISGIPQLCRNYERQLAEAQKDAERYRWLRDNIPWSSGLKTKTFYLRAKNYTGFDDAVDAAIAAAPSVPPRESER